MRYLCLISAGAMLAATAPATALQANLQTAPITTVARPATPTDTLKVTQADSGSAIDQPPAVGAEPLTGYHAPVIPVQKPAERPPHTRARAAERLACKTARSTGCQQSSRP